MEKDKGLRIILIDDRDDQIAIWSEILKIVTDTYRKFWFETFTDPQKALESIENKNRVAAVICDLDLGESILDGVSVYKNIKYGLGKTVPFMLMAADKEKLDLVKLPKVHKVVKPVKIDEGVKLISDMIEDKLDDIRWTKLESSVEDITDMLKKHVKIEESQITFVISRLITNFFKFLVNKFTGVKL